MLKILATFSFSLLISQIIVAPSYAGSACDQRLTKGQSYSYKLQPKKVAPKNKALYTELVNLLNRVPTNIFQSSFETMVTPVNDYFWELYSYRLEILNKLESFKSLTHNKMLHGALDNLADKLKITEERQKYLIRVFEEHDYVQLGVLLNRRASDFPTTETSSLVSYLDELSGTVRGHISEFVVALEQTNVQAISIILDDYINTHYSEELAHKIKQIAGEKIYDDVATLELDVVYETRHNVYFAEVKNTTNFANAKHRFHNSQTKYLMERKEKLHRFFDKVNPHLDHPFRLHYIFMGLGVAKELQEELYKSNTKVN